MSALLSRAGPPSSLRDVRRSGVSVVTSNFDDLLAWAASGDPDIRAARAVLAQVKLFGEIFQSVKRPPYVPLFVQTISPP